jgi:branched-chain amino acid aminotransferase
MFWLNGEILEGPAAPFDLTDRGLLLGDGLFDTSLVLGGTIFRGKAHLDRLFEGLARIGIEADHDAIERAAADLSQRGEKGVLRISVTRGPGPRGLRPAKPQLPTILASLAPLVETLFFAPLSLSLTAIRRNETSPIARLKSVNYLDAVLAAGEAATKGFDEALFLNCAGKVCCAAAGNVFAVFGRDIVTPPVGDGILPGILRGLILAELGGREASLSLPDIGAADALFVTNSVRLVAPVTRIGDRTMDSAKSGVVAGLQQKVWQAIRAECAIDLSFSAGGLRPNERA